MTRYFAYGTNMDRAGMRVRCPGACALGPALLQGWRIMVMRAGYVSIVAQADASVHGVLWRLGPCDLAALDRYEAVDAGLYRRQMLPVLVDGRPEHADTYIGGSDVRGRARPRHLEAVIAAAQSWHLPAAYLAELQKLTDG